MRIAIFIKATTFHKNHGGLEVQNRILAEGLAESNEVMVYSPKGGLDFTSKIEKSVFYKFIDARYKNKNILESILNVGVKSEWDKKSYDVLLNDHREKPFDVVVSQSSAGLGIIKRKKELGVKVVSIAHGTIWSEFRTLLARKKSLVSTIKLVKDFEYTVRNYLTRQKQYLTGSDLVIAVSEFVAGNVAKESGIPMNKIKVIHNGVSEFSGNALPKPESPITILYVGRIEEDKGVFELVTTFANLIKKQGGGIRLLIAGEGPDLTRLKEVVKSSSLEDPVSLLGYLNREELETYYLTSHIFVLPTKRIEGFPVTIPEGMIAGLPIVAFDLGGIREGVFDGKSGFLIRKGRWDMFEEKLETLIGDANLRVELGEHAKALAKSEFSRDTMVHKYLDVLKGLV